MTIKLIPENSNWNKLSFRFLHVTRIITLEIIFLHFCLHILRIITLNIIKFIHKLPTERERCHAPMVCDENITCLMFNNLTNCEKGISLKLGSLTLKMFKFDLHLSVSYIYIYITWPHLLDIILNILTL